MKTKCTKRKENKRKDTRRMQTKPPTDLRLHLRLENCLECLSEYPPHSLTLPSQAIVANFIDINAASLV